MLFARVIENRKMRLGPDYSLHQPVKGTLCLYTYEEPGNKNREAEKLEGQVAGTIEIKLKVDYLDALNIVNNLV